MGELTRAETELPEPETNRDARLPEQWACLASGLWSKRCASCKRNETQESMNSQSTTDLMIQRYAPNKETFEYVYRNIGVAAPVKRRTRKTKAVFRDFVLF